MMSSSTRLLAALAVVCAGAFGTSAAMAQGTFTPGTGTGTNCNLGNSGTQVSSKDCTVGSVTATMTAWGYTGNTLGSNQLSGFTQGMLADWDSGGFGAYTGNDVSNSPNHAFDNFTGSGNGGGSIEGLLLNFGTSKVNLTDVGIGWNSGMADLSVWAWTGAGAVNMTTQTASGNNTGGNTAAAMAGWTLVSDHDFGNGTGTQSTGNTLYSSYFLITTYFGANQNGLGSGNDAFKVNSFTVGVCGGGNVLSGGNSGNGSTCGPGQTTGVPEPGSLALVGIAFLGAYRIRRRRGAAAVRAD